MVVFWLVICAAFAFIPAIIAANKGREPWAWWIYGFFFFVIALVHALLIKPTPEELERRQLSCGSAKKCPQCAELVKADALVCRFCQHHF